MPIIEVARSRPASDERGYRQWGRAPIIPVPERTPRPDGSCHEQSFHARIRHRADDDEQELVSPLPAGARNYMTPGGFGRMKDELERLVQKERPELVATVAWAAGNGDRSENGDYIYGKKRLREIDRRIRFLIRRLDAAEVVDPAARSRRRLRPGVLRRDGHVAEREGRRAHRQHRRHRRDRHRRAATSAGFRRWRARSSRRARATPSRCIRRAASTSSRSCGFVTCRLRPATTEAQTAAG